MATLRKHPTKTLAPGSKSKSGGAGAGSKSGGTGKSKAKAKPQRDPNVRSAAQAGKEARQILAGDRERRLADAERILSADDTAGLYDVARQLFTSIDGEPRAVTADDLKVFRKEAERIKKRHAGKKYRGGITAKQVIDLSLAGDRQRANDQIKTVIPMSNRAGVVHFQTNSGPDSDVVRHHVNVEFLDYKRALADPSVPRQAYRIMTGGAVRFDCTCDRHTYWFRYIATIGEWNHGRPETGYPKIRNPRLQGAACKHVIRVMATIAQSPTFADYAQRMLTAGRKTLDKKQDATTVREQQEFIDRLTKERARQRKAQTTEEKRAARANQPAEKRKAAARAAMKKSDQDARQRYAKANRPVSEAEQIRTMMKFGWTEAQAKAALRAAKEASE